MELYFKDNEISQQTFDDCLFIIIENYLNLRNISVQYYIKKKYVKKFSLLIF